MFDRSLDYEAIGKQQHSKSKEYLAAVVFLGVPVGFYLRGPRTSIPRINFAEFFQINPVQRFRARSEAPQKL